MPLHILTIAVWLALASASALRAQPLTLAEILFRANQYVVRYEKDLSAVVSEERYTQRIVGRHGVKRTRELDPLRYRSGCRIGDTLFARGAGVAGGDEHPRDAR